MCRGRPAARSGLKLGTHPVPPEVNLACHLKKIAVRTSPETCAWQPRQAKGPASRALRFGEAVTWMAAEGEAGGIGVF